MRKICIKNQQQGLKLLFANATIIQNELLKILIETYINKRQCRIILISSTLKDFNKSQRYINIIYLKRMELIRHRIMS